MFEKRCRFRCAYSNSQSQPVWVSSGTPSITFLLIVTIQMQLFLSPLKPTKEISNIKPIEISGSIGCWAYQKTHPLATEPPPWVHRLWKLCLPVCGQPNLEALSYIFLSVTCYTVLGPNAYVNMRLGFMASSTEQECPGLHSSPQERGRVVKRHSAATGQSSAISWQVVI